MKKSTLQEFEMTVRDQVAALCAQACTVRERAAEAEQLVEEALLYGARKFASLENKMRVLDIVRTRIGQGTCRTEHSGIDTHALLCRVVARAGREQKKRGLLIRLTAALCAVAVAVGGVLAYALTRPDVGDAVLLMDRTQIFEGDFGRASIINYHDFNSSVNRWVDFMSYGQEVLSLGYTASAVATPDGGCYFAYQDIRNTDGSNNTFTLYRGEKEGWTAVGEGITDASYKHLLGFDHLFPSPIQVLSDKHSNAYVLVIEDERLAIHRYDAAGGAFTRSEASVYYAAPSGGQNMLAVYDADYGEDGAIYIALVGAYSAPIYRYDVATDTLETFCRGFNIGADLKLAFCVQNDTVHLAATYRNGSYHGYLVYYRIEADGTKTKIPLWNSDGHILETQTEDIFDIGGGGGGIAVDKNGVVHLLASHTDFGTLKSDVRQYLIDPDGAVASGVLQPLFFAESEDYHPECAGVFADENGDVYYLETYSLMDNFIAFGKLDSSDPGRSECMEAFEFYDSVSRNRMRVSQGGAVVFQTGKRSIFYFSILSGKES